MSKPRRHSFEKMAVKNLRPEKARSSIEIRKIGFSLMSDAKHFRPTLRFGFDRSNRVCVDAPVVGKQKMDKDFRYFRFAVGQVCIRKDNAC